MPALEVFETLESSLGKWIKKQTRGLGQILHTLMVNFQMEP